MEKIISALKLTLIEKGILLLGTLFLFNGEAIGQQNNILLFDLDEVELLESDFKHAQQVDLEYIMELEPDRLLAPFLREAGLDPKAESYPNWENSGLDGHIGGHYLSALSLMYASTGNEEVLERLQYMLKELKRVQMTNGNGYIGGVPGSRELWRNISKGRIEASSFSLNDRWVPLYNIHKTYAGLYDVFTHTGSVLAKDMLIDYTDWMLEVTRNLREDQIQILLRSEHGGLNEVFANVARITGEKKYMDLAIDFSHEVLLGPLSKQEDSLNGMHANTQIPKVIGFETIAQVSGNEKYHRAARSFWEQVTGERTVAIGGNSVREHFHPKSDFSSMITSVQGPETCNTYNMLKLSKALFQAEGLERYIEYYEIGLYNHILSSQHPEKGGFVYFTPMRPGHYRVYSQPETSFWCCVGSGIENHGKYNELIYAHTEDDLLVNLFIPSVVHWKEKGYTLRQETKFPKEEFTSFHIETDEPVSLNLQVRIPNWVTQEQFLVSLNGAPHKVKAKPGGYFSILRTWRDGDEITMTLPMHLSSEKLPDGSGFAALKYGPLVLAAKIGKEKIEGIFADSSRGGHIAEGKKIPLSEMPYFISDKAGDLEKSVKEVPGKDLTFSAAEVIYPPRYEKLEFIPFYKIHDYRYVIYLPLTTKEGVLRKQNERKKQESEERLLAVLSIDEVAPGEQQPEADHFIESEDSYIGVNQNRHWRDARGWFSYVLNDEALQARKLRVTYFGGDRDRKFRILVNGELLAVEDFNGLQGNRFFTKEYKIPMDIVKNSKGKIIVKFEALHNSRTAGIYGVRLLRNYSMDAK